MAETEEPETTAGAAAPPPDVRLLRAISLRNILSFGPDTPPLELRALNVLIGPNGSGKSNLLDALTVFRFAPTRLGEAVRQHGSSVGDWIWKGNPEGVAELEISLTTPSSGLELLHHHLVFSETEFRFCLESEYIYSTIDGPDNAISRLHFNRLGQKGYLYRGARDMVGHTLDYTEEDPDHSIMALRRDPTVYPELSYLAQLYEKFRFYREGIFGRSALARAAQKPDVRNDYLLEDGSNLGLMLNKLRRDASVKARLIALLNELYSGITDFDVALEAGTAQLFLQEGNVTIPASRLSDGTLRFLSLLVILLQPTPPPLICLEEPELGLHPDAVLAIGKLLKEAAERTQLIVTTHSAILLDALGASPEDIIVCEKHDGATEMTRLNAAELHHWLKKYSLSELWTRGKIGGNRW